MNIPQIFLMILAMASLFVLGMDLVRYHASIQSAAARNTSLTVEWSFYIYCLVEVLVVAAFVVSLTGVNV